MIRVFIFVILSMSLSSCAVFCYDCKDSKGTFIAEKCFHEEIDKWAYKMKQDHLPDSLKCK